MEIERQIDTRQVMVALLSPGSYQSEACRSEQLRVLRKGNQVIPVLVVGSADRPLHLEARQYLDFTNPSHYPEQLQKMVVDLCGEAKPSFKEPFAAPRVFYVGAPPLAISFVVMRAARGIL